MYTDLHAFVAALERSGELRRISAPVSPVLEIAECADRESQSKAPTPASASAQRNDPRFHDRGGHALLFENVEGSDFPVLINAFGSYRRMEMALGCAGPGNSSTPNSTGFQPVGDNPVGFESIADRIAELVKPQPPRSLAEALAAARRFAPLLKIGPKRMRGDGPCQQVVKTGGDVDLTRLPIIKCWPDDGDPVAMGYPAGTNDEVAGLGHADISPEQWFEQYQGRFITLAGIHTIHADDRDDPKPASHNIGMYRLQLLGRNRLAMHWHMHHDGASHWRSWKRLGKPMPVAVALGGGSVLPYAATCPLPPGISELLMAGFLQGQGVRLCRGKTVPLWVPADAEIVIEGFVRTDAGLPGWDPRDPDAEPLGPGAVFEGPFGDHTGFYSMPDRYPLLEVSAITHRENAIYPTTIVGLPPQEDYFLGKATERIMKPLLQTVIHDIDDYDLPLFGAFHNCACIKINKAFPLHAHRVINAVWGAGQMSWTKMIFVVDQDIDVHDTNAVLRAAADRCDPSRDLIRQFGPLDILDHAAPWLGAGGKIGFDCTRKIVGEDIVNQPRSPLERATHEQCQALTKAASVVQGVHQADVSPESGWLFISTELRGPTEVGALMNRIKQCVLSLQSRVRFCAVLDQSVDVANIDESMFHLCANADFARDLTVDSMDDGCAVAVIDATPKVESASYTLPTRAWPPIIKMNPETVEKVTKRYAELGL